MLRAFLFALLVLCLPALAQTKVTIVIANDAPPLEKRAAEIVARDFAGLFGTTTMQATLPTDGSVAVLIGSPRTNPAIPADAWPKLSEQGHVLRSTPKGLIVGGSIPLATLWAAGELGYHFGVRRLLHGDAMPIEKPAPKFDGIDVVFEPVIPLRGWNAFAEDAHSTRSWPVEEHERLIGQLAKLKFTHLVLPTSVAPFRAISLDGDVGGRAAFKGAKNFEVPQSADLLDRIAALAADHGLGVMRETPADVATIALGASKPSVLPQFGLTRLATDFQALASRKARGFVATAVMPGDLNSAAHFVSRASFQREITADQALAELVTPICGEGVAERLWKGFQQVEQAGALLEANDALLGVPDAKMLLRHLKSTEPPPAWLGQVKASYLGAMNEMYRGNTRARGGARPFILYHAKRLEFALQYCAAIEALRKAAHDAAARADAEEQAVEAIYNALNAYGDVARDTSDRGAIALLNEYGYRSLIKALEQR